VHSDHEAAAANTSAGVSPAAPATGDLEGFAELPLRRVDVSQIVQLIDLVDDIADLNEITFALDRRRRQLAEASAAD